jgi:hypothetical protein
LALLASNNARAQQVGEPLARWTAGTLDIHHINTGKGNAKFFVLPDATTLLVDAAAAGGGAHNTALQPDGSRTPGEWIARYIAAMAPAVRKPSLDSAHLTHLHGDHMNAFADVAERTIATTVTA